MSVVEDALITTLKDLVGAGADHGDSNLAFIFDKAIKSEGRDIPTEVKETTHGRGLFATDNIPTGTILDRYVGELGLASLTSDAEKYVISIPALVDGDNVVIKAAPSRTDPGFSAHMAKDVIDLNASVDASLRALDGKIKMVYKGKANCEVIHIKRQRSDNFRSLAAVKQSVVTFLVSTKMVQAGEELTLSYGSQYWKPTIEAMIQKRARSQQYVRRSITTELPHNNAAWSTAAGKSVPATDAFPPITLMASPIHGVGVVATAPIPSNVNIGTYDGTVHPANTQGLGEYVFALPNGHLLDGDPNDPHAQWPSFINASTEPNVAYLFTIDNRVIVRTHRPVAPGEELTASYGTSYFVDQGDILDATVIISENPGSIQNTFVVPKDFGLDAVAHPNVRAVVGLQMVKDNSSVIAIAIISNEGAPSYYAMHGVMTDELQVCAFERIQHALQLCASTLNWPVQINRAQLVVVNLDTVTGQKLKRRRHVPPQVNPIRRAIEYLRTVRREDKALSLDAIFNNADPDLFSVYSVRNATSPYEEKTIGLFVIYQEVLIGCFVATRDVPAGLVSSHILRVITTFKVDYETKAALTKFNKIRIDNMFIGPLKTVGLRPTSKAQI